MKPSVEQIKKAMTLLDSQDVPKENRIVRYYNGETGHIHEAKIDENGNMYDDVDLENMRWRYERI